MTAEFKVTARDADDSDQNKRVRIYLTCKAFKFEAHMPTISTMSTLMGWDASIHLHTKAELQTLADAVNTALEEWVEPEIVEIAEVAE